MDHTDPPENGQACNRNLGESNSARNAHIPMPCSFGSLQVR
jgi:hypothetical protein